MGGGGQSILHSYIGEGEEGKTERAGRGEEEEIGEHRLVRQSPCPPGGRMVSTLLSHVSTNTVRDCNEMQSYS